MNRKLVVIFLTGVIFVASLLRLWQLGVTPPSPDWDEAALGYNAYSIIETGKDEYGEKFPIVLRSFDDYKPALYAYLTVPSVIIFGLNTFAVRLPSAIFGILTVLATYFFVKELFKRDNLALLTSFLLAVSPWHIQFSRIAFETNVGLAFNIFAALFFLKGLKKPWLLTLSAIFAAFSIYTYQSEKVFTPLFILLLAIIYRKDLLKAPKKYLIVTVLTGILFISPMVIYIATNKASLTRAQGTLVFADKTAFLENNIKRLVADKKNNDFLGTILDNRRVHYLKSGISGYLSHYDLNWLFIKGDLNRHHAPGMGLLYFWELPFLFIGIYSLLFNKKWDKKGAILIFSWFLLAPVPAAFTSGVPHAVRTLNFLPTFQIFTAVGILFAMRLKFDTKYRALGIKLGKLFILSGLLFVGLNFAYFLNQYFVQQNFFYSQDWQYGYKEATDEIRKIEYKYKKIVVSNQPLLDQSYIFFLFYLKYPPSAYQTEGNLTAGFRENHRFGKFEFRPIKWASETDKNQDTLYVGRPDDFPGNFKSIKTIFYLDGTPAIEIGTKK